MKKNEKKMIFIPKNKCLTLIGTEYVCLFNEFSLNFLPKNRHWIRLSWTT